MANARSHFKDKHIDKNDVVTNKSTVQLQAEPDTDPDLGLAPLNDGRVICLRCTLLCSNIIQAKNHYREQHITKHIKSIL